jgi:MYXO-CTERM domain-containing protein
MRKRPAVKDDAPRRLFMNRVALCGLLLLSLRAAHAQTFPDLPSPPYTQEIYGSTSVSREELGGVAFAPDGDVWASECLGRDGVLHRFNVQDRSGPFGTPRAISPVSSVAGCGLTNHPDGFIYSNTAAGVVRLDANTGTGPDIRMGAPGNALGITVDPITRRLVYAGLECRSPLAGNDDVVCVIYDLDPATNATLPFATIDGSEAQYVVGVRFDPTGNYLFLATRGVRRNGVLVGENRLTILNRSGAIVQNVQLGTTVPNDISFHVSPTFVVTNDEGGTLTRYDFPNNDYASQPAMRALANGGFRSTLSQVGRDGCLYVTQNRTRFNVTTESADDSVVRICPSFVPPVASLTCTSDGDCIAGTPACQPNGSCGQCSATNSSQCSGQTPQCDVATGLCRGCANDTECTADPARPACQPDGSCGQCSATNSSQCSGTTPNCNAVSGTCRECVVDLHCTNPTLPACSVDGVCSQCSASNLSLCTGSTPACDLTNSTCRGCLLETECGGTTPACQPSGSCGQCSATNSSQCTGATPACDTATGTCRGCSSDADCSSSPETPACQPDGSCGRCSATNQAQCTGNLPACEVSTGTCRACAADGECRNPAMPACQPGGACGQCSASNNSLCTGATPVCDDDTGFCRRNCTSNAECGGATPVCLPRGVCGQCYFSDTSQCTGATPVCDPGPGLCRGCTGDGECGGGSTPVCWPDGSCRQCLDGVNEAACGGNTPECSDTGTCRGTCRTDDDCSGATPACAPNGVCSQCSETNEDQCSVNRPVCLSTNICGCTSDSDCGTAQSGRVCDTSLGVCLAGCRGTGGNGCPEGQACSSPGTGIGRCNTARPDGGVDGGPPFDFNGGGFTCALGGTGRPGGLNGLAWLALLGLGLLAARRRSTRPNL